ncbi:hypothetical protein [Mannheimia haemolytica]|uniref:hypothetical protein n=1 Tax=Mannheimia haemolytica TaxID=75985 RepID=UPI00115C693B|nr:hypothetical protein [Mannheimia haemolytica]MDW1150548.1 hypothetical protein [Mannheimia haemolytica]MDW1160706.1 hypothetical protein [Mannheimia haemolytica]NBB68046.1 hypothetical protein [Mannheimia haemolytica]TRC51474.1 hypothetical protein FEA40_00370 [Mannheimia haemolytica]TRC51573.1 hypothetical protein FEA32_00340 [Mannheimia haemolytica]
MSILVKENERFIANCEFKLYSSLDDSFKFNINDFTQYILNNYWKKTYFLHKKTSAYRILRARLIQKRFLVIYMQYSNSLAANPAFANLIDGKSRIIAKGKDEGIACSAHLVIDTTPTNIPNRFKAVLEDMQGLSSKTVCNLINHIVRNYKVQDPSDKNRLHRPYVNLTFLAKNNFEEQLNEGKIDNIVAFRETVELSSVLDDDEEVIKYKEIHRLEFAKPSFKDNPIDYIARAVGIAQDKGFNKLKITHKSNNKTQSANYKFDNSKDYNELYEDIRLSPFISKELITLSKPLGICNHRWSSQIIREMVKSIK